MGEFYAQLHRRGLLTRRQSIGTSGARKRSIRHQATVTGRCDDSAAALSGKLAPDVCRERGSFERISWTRPAKSNDASASEPPDSSGRSRQVPREEPTFAPAI